MYHPVSWPPLHFAGLLRALILALALVLPAACGGGQDSAKDEKAGMQSAGRVTETLRGLRPSSVMAVGAGSLWLTHPDHGTITRVDLSKREVVARIKVSEDPQLARGGADPQSVTASGDQIWFTDRVKEAVSRIDPKTNCVVERIPVGTEIYDIAIDGDVLWLTDFEFSVVLRVDTTKIRAARCGVVCRSSVVHVAEAAKSTLIR